MYGRIMDSLDKLIETIVFTQGIDNGSVRIEVINYIDNIIVTANLFLLLIYVNNLNYEFSYRDSGETASIFPELGDIWRYGRDG